MATSQLGRFLQRVRRAGRVRDGGGLTDGQLLGRFLQEHDEAAFEVLVRRHGPMVLGVCRRVLHDPHDAEDAFQATFLVLVRRAASLVRPELVGNFLYGVAYRTALEARTKAARRRAKEKQVKDMPHPAVQPEDAWRDLQPVLDQELSRLPDKYRVPLVLCDLEGRSRKEVAGQLGIPEGTLSSRLATARRVLAGRLAGRGLVLPGGVLAAGLAHGAASACVPAALVTDTVTAAAVVAGKVLAAGLLSARVAALTEGVLKTMFLSKLQIATVLLLGIAVAAAAGGFASGGLVSGEPQAPPPAARQVPAVRQPDAKPDSRPSRAEQFKALEAEYRTAYDELLKQIRAGKVKVKDGVVPEAAELRKRFAARARTLIDADPKDGVALDAILFSMRDLVADQDDPKLYDLLAAHHLASPKLAPVLGRSYAGEPFLRAVIARTPHVEVRGRATFALAERLYRDGRPREAEALLGKITADKEWAKLGHHHGSLGKGAENLLFEVRHLNVGQTVPEVEGEDMDHRPMKLSEYRGKVVLLVFWATWCGPCMAMVPHERELAKRYAGRPFAVVGVNGDGDILYGPKGEEIDEAARVKERMKREGITWRSFRNGPQGPINRRWNVDSWPTVYLIDHRGVIRLKSQGAPEEADLDAAVEKLVAEAAKKPGGK
jgi:RNA polymerase sigma factor (sigma-70 family)